MEWLLLVLVVPAGWLVWFVFKVILGAAVPKHVHAENALKIYLRECGIEPEEVGIPAIKELASNIAEVSRYVSQGRRTSHAGELLRQARSTAVRIAESVTPKQEYQVGIEYNIADILPILERNESPILARFPAVNLSKR